MIELKFHSSPSHNCHFCRWPWLGTHHVRHRTHIASRFMMDNLDVNALFAIPGGENFQDVTKLFSDASRGQLEPLKDLVQSMTVLFPKIWNQEVWYLLRDSLCKMLWVYLRYAPLYHVMSTCIAKLSSRSAKIGEPRLDTGITLQEERRPPFNPLVQLLPEEVCWILDRSFACEVIGRTHAVVNCTYWTSYAFCCRWNGMQATRSHKLCSPYFMCMILPR